jgi:starch synthase (maltosyl-transferring)
MSSNYGVYGPVYEFVINKPHEAKEEYADNEKYEIKHWDWDKYSRVKEIIARINKIRRENRALQATANIVFVPTSNDQIICYGKADVERENIIVTVVNLDPYHTQGAHVQLPLEKLGIKGTPFRLNDLLSSSKYTWHEEWNYVELNPYMMPAHVFRIEQ